MWRNYLSAALGNLARSRFYAGVTIAGLAIGFAAALLIALFVRDELTFDRFLPGYRQVYLVGQTFPAMHGRSWSVSLDTVLPTLAAEMKLDFPQIDSVARLTTTYHQPLVRRGRTESYEPAFVWADPSFFRVLPFKAIAGDLATALNAPDAIVLTRTAARKYFGRDAPLGQTLVVDPAMDVGWAKKSAAFNTPHLMRVTAVVEDLPHNSSIKAQLFGSSLAPYSKMSLIENDDDDTGVDAFTFIRLRPGASASDINRGLADFAVRRLRLLPGWGIRPILRLTPIADLHLSAPAQTTLGPRGAAATIGAISLVAVLIVITAAINFVTLLTARAARRAVETGVRKALGARRLDLIAQFLAEALIYVALSMLLAMMLAELLLPSVNAFLQGDIRLNFFTDPSLLAAIAVATVVLGLLAGFYPALVLSAFRPAAVLKGGWVQAAGGRGVRQALVVVQFAIMVGLVITAATLYRQTAFALTGSQRLNGTQIVLIDEACPGSLRESVAALPGVRGAACSFTLDAGDTAAFPARGPGGRATMVAAVPVDFGFFELFDLKPLAGRFFIDGRDGDGALMTPGSLGDPSVVINETAARRLGFATPGAAVGRVVDWKRPGRQPVADTPMRPSEIIGVVPDFSFGSIRRPIPPAFYLVDPAGFQMLNVRLIGRDIPETLHAIDKMWSDRGRRHMHRHFLDQDIQAQYADIILQGEIIGVGAGLAVIIACLGLFALSAFTTERRTKEIGIRKALGAGTGDVVRLLLWQFTVPVLVANLIAWPVAWWAMSRWLEGFAYRVDLPAWLFLVSGAAAVVIAWATVGAHTWLVARARPVAALRYE